MTQLLLEGGFFAYSSLDSVPVCARVMCVCGGLRHYIAKARHKCELRACWFGILFVSKSAYYVRRTYILNSVRLSFQLRVE